MTRLPQLTIKPKETAILSAQRVNNLCNVKSETKYIAKLLYRFVAILEEWWSANSNGNVLKSFGYKEGHRVDIDIPEGKWAQAFSIHDILIFNTGHYHVGALYSAVDCCRSFFRLIVEIWGGGAKLRLLPNLSNSGVSLTGSPRASPVTSPRVLTKDFDMALPASEPRVPSIVHPRASGVVALGPPLRGIEVVEQVTMVNVDHLELCALGHQSTSFGPVVAPSWCNVVANGVGSQEGAGSIISPAKMKLDYIPPGIVNDRVVVSPPEDVELLGQSKWKRCVVGHFLDKKLGFTAVRNIAMRIWEKCGIREVLSNEKGKLLILKLWYPHLKLEKEQLSTIPLWVHFFNVPLELWTGSGLSYVASSVGRPLYADHLTESGQRLSFAKICVEVDCSSPLPSSFDLKYANGDMVEIRVQYPWKPMMCSDYMVFGHGVSNCPKKVPSMGPEAVKNHVNLGKNVAPGHTEWQAVETLRKSQQPPSSRPIDPTSTSKPVANSTNSDIGSFLVIALPYPLTEHAGTPFSILERAALVDVGDSSTIPKAPSQCSSANKFVALDGIALWDDVGDVGTETSMNVVLPDDLFDAPHIGGDVLVAAIAEDFSVVPPQSSTLPLGSASKQGQGKGGSKGPPTTKGGRKRSKR
ncbi:hypothetical protein RHSIM_Rhsim11G0147600 [Rhododendron simsii]|uniref:DUF4283 domain-containing protein n=1 Tax=Rhododendron simsii TaxID=118357 RepID=A0A834G8J9_RHOSS|nr:hypothetical protein RHSIM_Rhsim11G0147600 [Rhododendron simsii]